MYLVGGIWIAVMIALSPQFLAAHRETKNVLLTFDHYSAALINQNFDEAYQYCGSDFHEAMPFERFVSIQQSLEGQLGHLRSTRRIAYELQGKGAPKYWKAVIDADMLYERKTLRFQFIFRKESGRWILYGYQQL